MIRSSNNMVMRKGQVLGRNIAHSLTLRHLTHFNSRPTSTSFPKLLQVISQRTHQCRGYLSQFSFSKDISDQIKAAENKISDTEQEIRKVEEEICTVEEEIRKVEEEIRKVEEEISRMEIVPYNMELHRNKLQTQEQRLYDDKKQLRTKVEQLRNKEQRLYDLMLLKKDSAGLDMDKIMTRDNLLLLLRFLRVPQKNTTQLLPFYGRERSIECVLENIKKREHQYKKTSDRNSFPFLVAVGAPGIGKTTLLDELPEYVQKRTGKSSRSIVLSYGQQFSPTSLDAELPAKKSVALRLLYALTERSTPMGLETFMKISPFRSFDIDIELVLAHYLRSTNTTRQPMHLLLCIDEFQHLATRSKDTLEDVVKTLSKLLTEQPFMETENVFITLIFSGTLLRPLSTVLQGSGYVFETIPMNLLSASETRAQISTYLLNSTSPNHQKLRRCIPFWRLVQSFYGWPRPLTIFLSSVFSVADPDTIDWQHFASKVKIALQGYYPNWWSTPIETSLIEQLAIRTILRIPVVPRSTLAEIDKTWNELQALGFVSIDSETNQVTVPPLMLHWYLTDLVTTKVVEQGWHLMHNLFHRSIFSTTWQDWEVFCAQYEAVRYFLYARAGYSRIKITDFYSGAIYHPSLSGLEMDVPSTCTYHKAKQQWPDEADVTDAETQKSVSPYDSVILNAPRAKCDWFCRRRTPIAEGVLDICGQAKYTASSTLLSFSMIQSEYDKLTAHWDQLSSAENTETRKSTPFVPGRVILAVVSNRQLEDSKRGMPTAMLPKDTLVITTSELSEYFTIFSPIVLEENQIL